MDLKKASFVIHKGARRMDFVPGETRIGQYTVLEQLGSGAFASVWLGEHGPTGIRVSIKMIPKAAHASPE
jgi:serine/threonine protein kinase